MDLAQGENAAARSSSGQNQGPLWVCWWSSWERMTSRAQGEMASIVKGGDGKQVRLGQKVPPPYEGMPLVIYKDIVSGPYAAGGLAVAARKDDYDLMARHALLRAQARGWL
jgi:hypothetical protein